MLHSPIIAQEMPLKRPISTPTRRPGQYDGAVPYKRHRRGAPRRGLTDAYRVSLNPQWSARWTLPVSDRCCTIAHGHLRPGKASCRLEKSERSPSESVSSHRHPGMRSPPGPRQHRRAAILFFNLQLRIGQPRTSCPTRTPQPKSRQTGRQARQIGRQAPLHARLH